MGKYSIKEVEHLSGIKAHTLRMWEQRYGIVQPKRTGTNIRYYDDADLRRLMNIALLTKHGMRISKVAKMSDEELQKAVLQLEAQNSGQEETIDALALAMLELDEYRFEKVLSTAIVKYGFDKTFLEIVHPFMKRVGLLWQTSAICPAHEHFISCLIRQKLIVAIDAQAINPRSDKARFLLFLPEGEWHELTLLFSHYLIKKQGFPVLYLGQSVPMNDAVEAYRQWQPEYLLTVITTHPPIKEMQAFLYELSETFSKSKMLITGHNVVGQGWDMPDNLHLLNKIEDLVYFLESIA
ncbi:MAG: MerR family transcriptional regulator [Thermonema sp.]|uniref:MerR family transcriptional regulator n=1 Tax=Thermonema sp. TaxID=2231181 RepID=UPI0021DD3CEB|nr:MerR family transcriptional regulator [Thermonema sp.]GIV40012.1 MAG: MerR family transcriptional regulator [Thermonema sp.]